MTTNVKTSDEADGRNRRIRSGLLPTTPQPSNWRSRNCTSRCKPPDERLTLAHEHRGRDITSEEVDALRRTADNVAVFVMSGPYGPAKSTGTSSGI